MNTLHFKYAVEVAKIGSITQTAEKLFMAQPNLSKAIRELEDNLGFIIFERTSKGVTPTEKGAEFLTYARNVLRQIDKMEAMSDSKCADMQRFNISIPRCSYIASGFTNFVSGLDFEKSIDVDVQETNSMQTIKNISDGRFNLGVIRYQPSYENYFLDYLREKQLRYEIIWEFEYLILMSAKHPLSNVDAIHPDMLNTFTEIAHGDTAVPYLSAGETKKYASNAKKKIYVYERCSQFDLLSAIPYTYMWVSPIPENWLKRYGLIQRRCPLSENRFKDVLVFPKEYKFTGLDNQFINKMYQAKNEVSLNDYR